ncbi:MAG: TetR/AcrR family transcriptional regulator [Pelagimonas sp.]
MPTTKAEKTHHHILTLAAHEASLSGIANLTAGKLAKATGLSKSGLYAHFGSMQSLQIAVIDFIAAYFVEEVARPGFAAPVGEARLRALFDLWVSWSQHPDRPGGCQLLAASFDYDGLDSPVRDHLANWIEKWLKTLETEASKAGLPDPASTSATALALYSAQHIQTHLLRNASAADWARDEWDECLTKNAL